MRKIYVFVTGQYRCFWKAWKNLVANVIRPAMDGGFEPHVSVGMDVAFWGEGGRHTFETHLRNEWAALGSPPDHLTLVWVCHQEDAYFRVAVASLESHRRSGALCDAWFDYLVRRSGSCAEYAQACRLLDTIPDGGIGDHDLLLRTRTDVVLTHPICLNNLPRPGTDRTTATVFSRLFPTCPVFEGRREVLGREASILPKVPSDDRWCATLRKNLVYLMPMRSAGWVLRDVVRRYGDWDDPGHNDYWFNAESQFRGCLRTHGFTVWEHSQEKDECHGGVVDEADFPVYAICR